MVNELYKEVLEEQIIYLLVNSYVDYPEIDLDWVLRGYMNSEIRKQAEEGNPHYIWYTAKEIMMKLLKNKEEYPKAPKDKYWYNYDVLYWCGLIYNEMFFKFHVKGSKLIELLPITKLMHLYNPMHERSLASSTDILYETTLKDSDYKDYIVE